MTPEQQEKRRIVAEWLGFHPSLNSYHPLNDHWFDPKGKPILEEDIPDFINDESASALILEKLPMPVLKRVHTGRRVEPLLAWECWPDPTANGNYNHVRSESRREAIFEARYQEAIRVKALQETRKA